MELKPGIVNLSARRVDIPFNRTSMELKHFREIVKLRAWIIF